MSGCDNVVVEEMELTFDETSDGVGVETGIHASDNGNLLSRRERERALHQTMRMGERSSNIALGVRDSPCCQSS